MKSKKTSKDLKTLFVLMLTGLSLLNNGCQSSKPLPATMSQPPATPNQITQATDQKTQPLGVSETLTLFSAEVLAEPDPVRPMSGVFTISTILTAKSLNKRRMDKFFQENDWLQPDKEGNICNLHKWLEYMGRVQRFNIKPGEVVWLELTYHPAED